MSRDGMGGLKHEAAGGTAGAVGRRIQRTYLDVSCQDVSRAPETLAPRWMHGARRSSRSRKPARRGARACQSAVGQCRTWDLFVPIPVVTIRDADARTGRASCMPGAGGREARQRARSSPSPTACAETGSGGVGISPSVPARRSLSRPPGRAASQPASLYLIRPCFRRHAPGGT